VFLKDNHNVLFAGNALSEDEISDYLRLMLAEARVFCRNARADSTWIQYRRCFNKYVLWCSRLDLEPMPAPAEQVLAYLNQVRLDSSSYPVLLMHTCAIAAFHEDAGYWETSPTKNKSVVTFLKASQRVYGKPAKPKAAMTQSILAKFVEKCLGADLRRARPKSALGHMWRACIFELCAYLGMARFSDLIRLNVDDVTITKEKVTIFFLTRKNDQRHAGHTVELLATGGCFCPVKIISRYFLFLRASYGKEYRGAFLPSFKKDKQGKFVPMPGSAASYSAMRNVQKMVLKSIGLDPGRYGLHSGRRGAATDSAAAGNDASETCIFGGWVKGSSMPELYDAMRKEVASLKVAKALKLQFKRRLKI
jgi:integrase